MAHIGMVSIPAPGHVNPSLEIIRRLTERGHRVTYVNDPTFRDTIESAGAELAPYTSVLPRVNASGAEASSSAEPSEGFDGDSIDHLTKFQDEYEVMLPAAQARFEDDRPDLFLYDIAGIPARILADTWGIPVLQLSPTYVAWDGYEADMEEFETWLRTDPRGAAYLGRQRAMLESYGITTDPLEYLGHPARCVVLIPEAMQPNEERVDRDIYTFTGPAVRRALPDAWTPPAHGRVLLVSMGTAFTRLPDFYRRCLEAFAGLDDWHVVLQIGRNLTADDVTGGDDVPGNVEIHSWVPQLEILQYADAFITHAGMGGSNEGLVTGTPMIAAPQDVDQFTNADALIALGVGTKVDSATVTVEELRAALEHVSGDDVRRRAQDVAAEIERLGGAARAVEIIEEHLR